jgi:hypothetical protein
MDPEKFQNPEQRIRRRSPRSIFHRYRPIIIFVLFLLIGAGCFFVGQYSVFEANPNLQGQEQATQILGKVGKLILLPQNETPTMATITDAAQVKQAQPFLKDAEDGDVLIVYTTAGTAILYRPSTDKLIAVGPVTQGTSSYQKGETSTQVPASSQTIRNATTTTLHT